MNSEIIERDGKLMAKREIWETWDGMVVKNTQTGHLYIQTRERDWQTRLAIWRANAYHRDGRDNFSCPCPMPHGHIMFRNRGRGSSIYQPV
jgi:hypothetical protein